MAVEIAGIAILVAALILILLSCEVFVNGIEWLGCRLGLAETATGSILAAVGTAMPETIIPIIAIFMGSDSKGEEIGEGAILGAPFMLGTLAMFIGGLAIWLSCRKGNRQDCLLLRAGHAERDLKFFMMMYLVALFTGLLATSDAFDSRPVNYICAFGLLLAYVIYLRRTLKDEAEMNGSSCPMLYLSRISGIAPTSGRAGLSLIIAQVGVSLMGIIVGARFFVLEVEAISESVGIPAMVLAFLIAPVATELPEKFNSVIWYWRGKDTLALGNITGAMVFQSSFPVSIGLLFTHWELEMINILSIVVALVAAAWIYYSVHVKGRVGYRTLMAAGSLYVLYIILLLVFPVSSG